MLRPTSPSSLPFLPLPLRSVTMRTTLILMWTRHLSFAGGTRLEWSAWRRTKRKRKSSQRRLQSKYVIMSRGGGGGGGGFFYAEIFVGEERNGATKHFVWLSPE